MGAQKGIVLMGPSKDPSKLGFLLKKWSEEDFKGEQTA